MIGKSSSKLKTLKMEFRGNFRIVGTIEEDKHIVGYVILDVKNGIIKPYTERQTKLLIARYKFENAVLDGDKVVNTECSMNRILKFNTNQEIIGNKGYTILGAIYIDGVHVGFSVLSPEGKIIDKKKKELVNIALNSGLTICNARLVPKDDGSHFISGIKSDFKRIDKALTDRTLSKDFKDAYEDEGKSIEEKHRNFLKKIIKLYTGYFASAGAVWVAVNKANEAKQAKIFINEYALVQYPELASLLSCPVNDILTVATALTILERGVPYKYTKKIYVHGSKTSSRDIRAVKANAKPLDKACYSLKLVEQNSDLKNFLAYRDAVILGEDVKRPKIDNDILNSIATRFVSITLDLKKKAEKFAERERKRKIRYNPAEFDYSTEETLNKLGYTVNKELVGKGVNSIIYGDIKLRWIFDNLNLGKRFDETKYLNLINCFGDVELMRKIKKAVDYNTEVMTEVGKAFLGIIAIYNLPLAKEFNKDFCNFSGIDLDTIGKERFVLNNNDRLFYESGGKFNKSKELRFNESWGYNDMNRLTDGLLSAMALHLNITDEVEYELLYQWRYTGDYK